MPHLGWIIASAPDEASPINGFWSDDEDWVFIEDPNVPGAFDSAAFYPDSCTKIESLRHSKGEFQSRYTDRDIRLIRAEQSVRLV